MEKERERQNQRKAYGEAIVALGAENPNVVVLEADLGKSTMSASFKRHILNVISKWAVPRQI